MNNVFQQVAVGNISTYLNSLFDCFFYVR